MTRRECLVRVLGAVAAAAVAPLINLTDQTPAFWNQEPIKKLLPWRIVFPDGATYSFDATVIAEAILADGSLSLSLQPNGPMNVSVDAVYEEGDGAALDAGITMLRTQGGSVMELQEIELPTLSLCDGSLAGLKRKSLTFTVKLGGEKR